MATLLHDAEWWHLRAEQCRARADNSKDPQIRARMLAIAQGYDGIADDTKHREEFSRSKIAPKD